MVNLKSPISLQSEFDEALMRSNSYHDDMAFYLDAYYNNVYYPSKPNAPVRTNKGINTLQIFADKMHFSLAEFPQINVPAVPGDRENASIREKILYSTHHHNNSSVMWARQAFDATVLSAVITVAEWSFEEQCVKLRRIDPRFAFWRDSDGVNDDIDTFWEVKPVLRSRIEDEYGVKPQGSPLTVNMLATFDIPYSADDEYFAVITRHTAETTVRWVGTKMLIRAHAHGLGRNPAVVTFPIEVASQTKGKSGDFYLRKLVGLAAEFNEYWRQRANIVKKLGNPTVYAKGLRAKQFQPIKDGMSLDGGFVGLSENGELGILSIPETKMIDMALADTYQRMKDIAGFPTATFGESVGANTSGDALGMYFQPTTKMVSTYTTPLARHMETINGLILRFYDTRLPLEERKKLYGTLPNGKYIRNESGERQGGAYSVEFGKQNINGQYHNVVTMPSVTPKDDIAHKRLWFDAAREKIISRTTFYDKVGFLSPQDELSILKEESEDPMLNMQGAAQMMSAAAPLMQQPTPPPKA